MTYYSSRKQKEKKKKERGQGHGPDLTSFLF
jgi:hypothetical protein